MTPGAPKVARPPKPARGNGPPASDGARGSGDEVPRKIFDN
jgi:hypothetical protein